MYPDDLINNDIIRYGNYAIMRRTFDSNAFKLVRIGIENYFYFGKQKVNIQSLIGQKFGSTFELNNERNLELINLSDYFIDMVNEDSNVSKDNRHIRDDNKSQKLTRNDIEQIKKESSGKDVILSLVENSSTFEEKNKFSQEKYLVKKKQKYLNLFTVLKPSVKFLIEMYYSKGPVKNNYLRIDSLSQMLTSCNVMSGGNYIVVDSNLGILSAALMERTYGNGSIIQVYTEDIPNGSSRQAVHALNYPDSTISDCLFSININDVAQLLNEDSDKGDTIDEEPTNQDEETLSKKEKRQLEINKAKSILRRRNMDGLLILTKNYDPYYLANVLLEFVGLSRPFAIFSSSIEPLKECYIQLKNKSVFLRITETWLRKYQVLNDRTRPEMVMNPSSGFILSAIKVQM